MILKRGGKYNVNTNYGTILNTQLKVIATDVDYEFIQTIPFDIQTLALSEKIENIDELSIISYYICKDNDDKYVIIWDDIIDTTKTDKLNSKYGYRLDLTISDMLTVPRELLINELKSYIESKYPNEVKIDIIPLVETEENLALELFKEKSLAADRLINKVLSGEDSIIKMHDIVTTDNSLQLVNDMFSDIRTITTSINKISSSLA